MIQGPLIFCQALCLLPLTKKCYYVLNPSSVEPGLFRTWGIAPGALCLTYNSRIYTPMPVIGLALAFSALVTTGSPATLGTTTQSQSMPASQSVEEYVREYFQDAPVMIDIARCESRFTQLNKDGSVVKNPHSTAMGAFQIMASLHAESAQKNLGLNIYTLQGNAGYARYLYEKNGTRDWNASKACWGKSGHLAAAAK